MTDAPSEKAEILVLDLPEFEPVIAAARGAGYAVVEPVNGYWCIKGAPDIRFDRTSLGLGPALWNIALAGGVRGTVSRFDAAELVISGGRT